MLIEIVQDFANKLMVPTITQKLKESYMPHGHFCLMKFFLETTNNICGLHCIYKTWRKGTFMQLS